MKANEAPEKVFIRPRTFIGPRPSYIDENSKYGGIEYTRTDAFIEKACLWLKENVYLYVNDYAVGLYEDELIEHFENYTKGE